MTQAHSVRTPRGVVFIGSLLIVGAFFTIGMMLVPTTTLEAFNLPRSLLFVGGMATGTLAYGLLRLRRWAWFATLSFLMVNGYYLILGVVLTGTQQYAGLIVIAAAVVYLLRPAVRARFLRPTGA